MNGEVKNESQKLIEKLQSVLQNYDFVSDELNVEYIIAESIVHIRLLEKKYQELSELNSILRHNLKVLERKNGK